MKQIRNLHKQVRVVYRACRRIYGKEKTQDECLRVFKLVFPEIYMLRNSEEDRAEIPANIVSGISAIFDEWKPSGELKKLLDKIKEQMQMPFDWQSDELIQFYEDITPVAMRIRKLTPMETGRLMGMSEEELDIMLNCGISKSSAYKLHGNSIVVDVLYHVFKSLVIDTDSPQANAPKGHPIQLTLW